MRILLLSSVLAAGVAAIVPMGTAQGQPFAPEPFDPQTAVIRMGGAGTSFLGVNLREVDAERAKELKLKEEAGVEITRVEEDSPAAKAGLKVGDVVLSYNGQRVEGMDQFSRMVRETPPGREVKLSISRDGNVQTLVARLAARKMYPAIPMPRMEMPSMAPMPDLPRAMMMWRTSVLGVEAEALHGQLADYFGVKEGVLVRSVMKETAAYKAGLKAGDVIVRIGDSKVTSPGEISSAIRSMGEKKSSVPIVVIRDHKEITLTASIDDLSGGDMPAPPRIAARPIRM
jgi:serine protease Do